MKYDWDGFSQKSVVEQQEIIELLERWSEAFRRNGDVNESRIHNEWALKGKRIMQRKKLQKLNEVSENSNDNKNPHFEIDPYGEEDWDELDGL